MTERSMSVLELTNDNFQKEVLQSTTPVLVDFWAPWCGPCKIMGPVIDAMAQEWKGKTIKFAKLNVDDHSQVAGSYKVMSIPTFLLIKNGAVEKMWRGIQDKNSWTKEIEAAL